MKFNAIALGFVAPANALLRFGCSQLTIQRLDPLVTPGQNPSPHLHQIIGGNSFNVSMHYPEHDLVERSTCTTCQFTEDFSNYWTAVLFFRARNGTFKRVPQLAQLGMEGTKGGMVWVPTTVGEGHVLTTGPRSCTTCQTLSSTPLKGPQ